MYQINTAIGGWAEHHQAESPKWIKLLIIYGSLKAFCEMGFAFSVGLAYELAFFSCVWLYRGDNVIPDWINYLFYNNTKMTKLHEIKYSFKFSQIQNVSDNSLPI